MYSVVFIWLVCNNNYTELLLCAVDIFQWFEKRM